MGAVVTRIAALAVDVAGEGGDDSDQPPAAYGDYSLQISHGGGLGDFVGDNKLAHHMVDVV